MPSKFIFDIVRFLCSTAIISPDERDSLILLNKTLIYSSLLCCGKILPMIKAKVIFLCEPFSLQCKLG